MQNIKALAERISVHANSTPSALLVARMATDTLTEIVIILHLFYYFDICAEMDVSLTSI